MTDASEPQPAAITPAPAANTDVVQRTRWRGGCFGALVGMLGCLLIPLVLLALPVLLGLITANNLIGELRGGVERVINPPPPVAQVSTSPTLLQSILPLGQLVSVNTQLAKADIAVRVEQGVLNACGYSANHVAVGSIEAGVDLSTITDDNISYDESRDTYVVTLPPAQLTSCRIDFIRQYDRSTTACGVDWDEIRLLGNAVALRDFRDDALESGVIERAQREATLTLQTFVQALTGKTVEIVFMDASETVLPPSCIPQPPEGWVVNADTGVWTKP